MSDRPDFLNLMQESAHYEQINRAVRPKRRRKIYSHEMDAAARARIPPSLIKFMESMGWTPLGIYEVVDEEIKREKRNKRKQLKG